MSRRFAAVFTHELLPVQRGKEVGLIPLGLERLGWDVELHAPSGNGEGWPYPVRVAPLAELGSDAYWAGRGIDAALVFSFFRHRELMATMRRTGAAVLVKGDTDGLLSARRHPLRTLEIALHHQGSLPVRAAQVAHWLARLGPLHRREVTGVVDTVAAADALTVESERARSRIAALLRSAGRGDLEDRLHVVPSPVAPVFAEGDAGGEREPIVVAAGRWDDGQKNAPLLAAALRRFLRAHPGWRAHAIGAHAERRFHGERIEAAERMPQDELARLLRRARIVVSSSRYESFSLAIHEGLASGCTLAATPLAPFEHAVSEGPYGSLATRRGPDGLADALAREAAAWEAGEHDPVAIAAFWRERLGLEAIGARYDALATRSGAPTAPAAPTDSVARSGPLRPSAREPRA